MKKIVVLLLVMFILTGCKKDDKNIDELNVYKTKEVCKKTTIEEVDGEILESQSIIYLDYDEANFVNLAIYQSITDISNVNSYTYSTYEYIRNLYSGIDGVNVIYYDTKDSLVLEIRYDYTDINLEEFRNNLGDLIDMDSLLGSTKKLPVKMTEFKKKELGGYVCEVME